MKNTINWIYRQHISGDFWFVDLKDKSKGYYVFYKNKLDAFDWDEVLAETRIFNWREEAIIKKVTKRSEKILIWEFVLWKAKNKDKATFWFVILNNKWYKNDIFIAWKYIWLAKEGDIVWVKILKWEWKNPLWKIVNIVWKKWDKTLDIDSFVIEWWFDLKFPKIIEKELSDLEESKDYKKRKDFTKLFTFTVDWDDAKDLDDAISIEKLSWWDYKLYVHIADVSNYVKKWSLLDREAYNRWNSVYLVDRVIPMLPEVLSNNLCSLNPDSSKLALSCEMIIWKDWKLKSTNVYESVIKSDYRFTYSFFDKIKKSDSISINDEEDFIKFNNSEISKEQEEKIKEKINLSYELKNIISKSKNLIWVLNFNFSETKIKLDDDLEVLKIEKYRIYESNKIIEEFMIMANEAISRKFSHLPFLYRVHERPSEEDMNKLINFLKIFWLNFSFKTWDTKEFSNLLELVDSLWKNKLVFEKMILRTLTKAVYSNDNLWHFWLWSKFYSHFTSPIRRYADLQIHRIIKEYLLKKLDKKEIGYYKNNLKEVWEKCSSQEKKAEDLEYKVRDYFIVKYYKNKLWEEFEWNIVWVIPKWLFVELEDSSEWFIELDYSFSFREELFEFEDNKNKIKYKLWDKIKVQLFEVDEYLLRLNFKLINKL